MDLQGKSVLVTGAGRGLGAALFEEFARAGARVVGVARTAAEVESVAARLRAEGLEAHAIAADVADKQQTYAIAGAAAALVGDVDVLVHNASALGPVPMPLLLDTACEDLEAVLQANLVGPFRLSKAVVGGMALRGEGVVVHVSSDAATNAYPRWGAYGVSKAASDHLARIFAAELDGTGVRFLAVDPGEMDTKMHADALPDADPSTLAKPAEVAKRFLRLLHEDLPTGSRVEAAAWST